VDDNTGSGVLAAVAAELADVWAHLLRSEVQDLETAEGLVRERLLAIGAQLLEAGLAVRGTGKTGPRHACACGAEGCFVGYRTKEIQTVVGWITVRRAYYTCRACGTGQCPLDTTLGLARDSLSPGVRRLSARLGALLPFAEAAATLAATSQGQLSASTVRTVTQRVGARCEQALATEIAAAWTQGGPVVPTPPPERLYVAMDGVRILSTDGTGREVKVGVVVPVRVTPAGERRAAASYAAGLEPAVCFGSAPGAGGASPGPGRGRAGRGPRRWRGVDLAVGGRALPPGHPDRRLVPRQ